MMTVTGLENDVYFSNNNIWMKIETDKKNILLIVGNYPFIFKTPPSGVYYFNLSNVVRGLIPIPNFLSPNNKIDLQILCAGYDDTLPLHFPFNRLITFVRGKKGFESNVSVVDGELLHESEKIPYWDGYPSNISYLINRDIATSNVLLPSEADVRRVINCEGLFLVWLNSRGGYNGWLFENVTLNEKSNEQMKINVENIFFQLGSIDESSLTLKSRIDKKFFQYAQSLVYSSEIYAYKLNETLLGISGGDYTKVLNTASSFNFAGHDLVKDFTISINIDKQFGSQLW